VGRSVARVDVIFWRFLVFAPFPSPPAHKARLIFVTRLERFLGVNYVLPAHAFPLSFPLLHMRGSDFNRLTLSFLPPTPARRSSSLSQILQRLSLFLSLNSLSSYPPKRVGTQNHSRFPQGSECPVHPFPPHFGPTSSAVRLPILFFARRVPAVLPSKHGPVLLFWNSSFFPLFCCGPPSPLVAPNIPVLLRSLLRAFCQVSMFRNSPIFSPADPPFS